MEGKKVNDTKGSNRIILSDPSGSTAEVLLHGGQVVSWKNMRREELLFMSSKAERKTLKAIRGGIPIFFPQFGSSGALDQHGFARNGLWSLDTDPSPLLPANSSSSVDHILKATKLYFEIHLCLTSIARLGPNPMAAFQICLQVWMTSSLLADDLAVAGQAILACAFAEKDYCKAAAAATRVLQMGFVLGLGLAVVVGVGLEFGARGFTKDLNVMHIITIGVPFVSATQPINSLAFVFDGVNFGAADFSYAAYSMVMVAAASIGSLWLLYKSNGFVGIWIALTIFMTLRIFAGTLRYKQSNKV